MGASSARGGTVTLTTTLGVLDPLGDGTAAQKLELPTPADGAVTATLRAGTFSGVTRVRASIGGVSVEKELTLAPALPTVIEVIAGTYALAAGSATSELTLYLPRDEAGSAVSAGVPVHLLTCSAAGDIAVAPRRGRHWWVGHRGGRGEGDAERGGGSDHGGGARRRRRGDGGTARGRVRGRGGWQLRGAAGRGSARRGRVGGKAALAVSAGPGGAPP